jgi:redox-sensitive bicupin YhaK (pirin superfamily)
VARRRNEGRGIEYGPGFSALGSAAARTRKRAVAVAVHRGAVHARRRAGPRNAGAKSPALSPAGITYLLVTFDPGKQWTFAPPEGHAVAFLSVANGSLTAGETVDAGELAAFELGEIPIAIEAGPQGASFVIGSAVSHRHDLVLGYYSVHTSAAALAAGEARIQAIRPR